GKDDYTVLLSPKRLLGTPEPRLQSLNGTPPPKLDSLLDALIDDVKRRLRTVPGIDGAAELEAVVGIPANANSLQRYRILEALRRGGFDVVGLIHEPTAAAIEYAHQHPRFVREAARHVLVYDLGGGTFDVSVVRIDADEIRVIASGGIEQ